MSNALASAATEGARRATCNSYTHESLQVGGKNNDNLMGNAEQSAIGNVVTQAHKKNRRRATGVLSNVEVALGGKHEADGAHIKTRHNDHLDIGPEQGPGQNNAMQCDSTYRAATPDAVLCIMLAEVDDTCDMVSSGMDINISAFSHRPGSHTIVSLLSRTHMSKLQE